MGSKKLPTWARQHGLHSKSHGEYSFSKRIFPEMSTERSTRMSCRNSFKPTRKNTVYSTSLRSRNKVIWAWFNKTSVEESMSLSRTFTISCTSMSSHQSTIANAFTLPHCYPNDSLTYSQRKAPIPGKCSTSARCRMSSNERCRENWNLFLQTFLVASMSFFERLLGIPRSIRE